jgi:DNA repair exonuclease SbcCD ATPase subunit
MKITRLETENVQRVKAVIIEPDGNLVIVGGKNASGKTSTIASIAMAIGGKRLCPDVPIRKGEKSGKAEVVLDNGMTVTRRFTPGGSTLTVSAADGRSYTSPQSILDDLTGELAFDPLAFIRMKPKEQGATLCALVGIDTTAIDAQHKRHYDQRTVATRDLKRAVAKLEMLDLAKDVPHEEVSVAELLRELKIRQQINRANAKQRSALETVREEYSTLRRETTVLEEELKDKNAELGKLAERGRLLSDEIKGQKEEDEQAIVDQIDSAEALNRKVRGNQQWAVVHNEVTALEQESFRLRDAIHALDIKREDLLAKATYPVPGMRVNEHMEVMLDGLPLSQASKAQQLQCSVSVGLALNPKLRVMIIYDGSLLDEDSLALLAKTAEEADAQLWIERVSEGKECTVVIEDGQVRG